MKTPFLGGHAVARSTNLADNKLINLYPEMIEGRSGKEVGAFFPCPGLTLTGPAAGAGPIRAMYAAFFNAGTYDVLTLYVVSGAQLLVSTGIGWTVVGPLDTYVGPVWMIGTGTNIGMGAQLAVFDSVGGYLVGTTGTFSTITLPFTGGISGVAYQDGYGLIGQANSQTIWQSNLFDLSAWSALTFQAATGSADQVLALASLHREIWVFKQFNTEIWVDNGTSPFAFGAIPGVFLHQGIAAPLSLARSSETLIWLSQNAQGEARVVEAVGYQAQPVSTFWLDHIIQGYRYAGIISDAIGYSYQQDGHDFYVLTFPTANATWCYDRATKLWHQRASFSNGSYGRHIGNCMVNFNGTVCIGDSTSGNIYSFDTTTTLDNGVQRKWVRSWRALATPTMQPVRFTSLTIDMQTGIGVTAAVPNPQVYLKWSDDGGHTWSRELQRSAGAIGETTRRVKFNGLGSTKRNGGLDRIFELSSADPFSVALIGADLQ